MARYSTSLHEFGMRTRRPHPFARCRTVESDRRYVSPLFALIWVVIVGAALPALVNVVSIKPSVEYLNVISPFAKPLSNGFGAFTLCLMTFGAVGRFMLTWRIKALVSALFASIAFAAIGAVSIHAVLHYTVPMVSLAVHSEDTQQEALVRSVYAIPACSTSNRRERKRSNCLIRTLIGTDKLRYGYQFTENRSWLVPQVFTFAAPNGLPVLKADSGAAFEDPKVATLTGRANWTGMQVHTVDAL